VTHHVYTVTVDPVLSPEARTAFRSISRPESYKPVSTGAEEARVGERAVYAVELTEEEAERFWNASNRLYLDRDSYPEPDVDGTVVAEEEKVFHNATRYDEWGFLGEGVDVGVIDSGLGAALKPKFSVKAARSEVGLDPFTSAGGNPHGSYVASIAVPRRSRLVLGQIQYGSSPTSHWTSLIYWMADTIGVDVINISSSSADFNQAYADAVKHADALGIAVFVSAGNTGLNEVRYPAGYEGARAIGNLDRDTRERHSTSTYGSHLWGWASGANVLTYSDDGSLTRQTGTSISAPMAAWLYGSKRGKTRRPISNKGHLGAMRDTLGQNGKIDAGAAVAEMPSRCGT
jgi:hypothetical protein